MTLVFILHRKLSYSGVFGKHNCRPLYNRSHFCSQQVQELPWTFLIVTINKCVWDSSFNLIMFDQWSLWQSSINSNNLLRYKNNEIFIILVFMLFFMACDSNDVRYTKVLYVLEVRNII